MLCISADCVEVRKDQTLTESGKSLKEKGFQEGKVLDVIAAWQPIFEQLFSQSAAIASGAAHAKTSAWPAYQRSSDLVMQCVCILVYMRLLRATACRYVICPDCPD